MLSCSVKESADYIKLKERLDNDEMLTDAVLSAWHKHHDIDTYPGKEFILDFFENRLKAVTFDDDPNHYIQTKDADNSYDFADDLSGIDEEALDRTTYYGSETVLSAPLDLSTEDARAEVSKLAEALNYERTSGPRFRPTGMTSLMGEEYDPFNGPMQRNPDTKYTIAGSAVHNMLDDAITHIIDSNYSEDKFTVKDEVKNYLKNKKDNGGYSHHGISVSDEAIEELATIANNLRYRYDFIGSELDVKGTDLRGEEYRGAVDLIVRDKSTGALGLLDYKTKTEKVDADSSFNKMHNLKTPTGFSKADNLQVQTLAYKNLINQKFKELTGNSNDLINFRGFVPISIEMDNEGNVTKAKTADIHNAERIGPMYYLRDNAEYRNMVMDKFGLASADISKALQFEDSMKNLKNVVEKAAEKYAYKSGKAILKDVFEPLSGFNILSDMPKIATAAREFCKTTTRILRNRPEDQSNIYAADLACDSMSQIANALEHHVEDGYVDEYTANITDVPREHVDRYTQDLKNTISGFVKEVEDFKHEVNLARMRELETHRKEFRDLAFEHYVLNKERESAYNQIKKELAEKGELGKFSKEDYYDEATERAMKIIDNNSVHFENQVNQVIDKLMYLANNNNDVSASMFKQYLERGTKALSPIANTKDVFVGHMVKTISDGINKVSTKSRQDRRVIEGAVKDLLKVTGKGKAKDVYGFMLDWRDLDDGRKAARIVTEFRDRDLKEAYYKLHDIVKKAGDWNESDMEYVREHFSEEDIDRIINAGSDDASKREMYETFHRNNYTLRDGMTRSQANREVRNNLYERVKELNEKGFISDSELKTIKSNLRSMVEMELPEVFHKGRGEDSPWKSYTRNLFYKERGKILKPTDKWKNWRYQMIEQMDESDPRKKFYNLYKEMTEMYDSYADESKQIQDNIPSVLDNHGAGFFRRDKINKEYNKDIAKGWLDFAELKEKSARIPLPFSGYQLDPDRQNYDLGLGLFKLVDSMNNYMEFSPRVASIELLYNHFADSTVITQDGAKKPIETAETKRLRDFIDKELYKLNRTPKAVKAINTVLSLLSIRALGWKGVVALNSHTMSAATLRMLGLGKDGIATQKNFAIAQANFVKQQLGGVGIAEAVKRDAVTKTFKAMDLLGFNDARVRYERFAASCSKSPISKQGMIDGAINSAFLFLKATDSTHKMVWTEASMRSQDVYDSDGKHLGSLWNNLIDDGKGGLKPSDKIAYTDKYKIHPFDMQQIARKMQQLIARTTSPLNTIDKPAASWNFLTRAGTMFRSIGLNFWGAAATGERVNVGTGEREIGMFHSLINKEMAWNSLGELGLGPVKVKNGAEAMLKVFFRPLAKLAGSETSDTWGKDIKGSNLTRHQRLAAQQMAKYVTYILLASGIKSLVKGTAEEFKRLVGQEHDLFDHDWFKLLLIRQLAGIQASNNPFEFFGNATVGGVVTSAATDVLSFLKQIANPHENYKSGPNKYKNKLWSKAKKVTGFLNAYDSMKNIGRTVKYIER